MKERWRCDRCDFDLCRRCLEKHHESPIEGANFEVDVHLSQHDHILKYCD